MSSSPAVHRVSLFIVIYCYLLTFVGCWIVDFNNPIVHTQYGSIRGKIDERKTKFNRRPICTFLSIPFARPPTGSNRFLVSITSPSFGQFIIFESTPNQSLCGCRRPHHRHHLKTNSPQWSPTPGRISRPPVGGLCALRSSRDSACSSRRRTPLWSQRTACT